MSLDLPSMRSEVSTKKSTAKPKQEVLACNLRIDTTMKAFERQGGRQMFEENLASSLGISMSSVQVTGMREGSVILDYNLIVDKNSKMSIDELKSLQNDKMKSGAIDVGGPVMSFTSTVPTSGSDEPKSNKRVAEPTPIELESPSESENEIEDVEISEPSVRKKQQPPEVEPKITENEFDNLSNEFSDEQESEESSEEEESESSSEDEDTKRENARRNRKR